MNKKKALVPLYLSYGASIDGLCPLTNDIGDFLRNTDDYELVLFTGGADIDPSYYGDTSPKGLCYSSPDRDAIEKRIFDHALKHGVKMAGICRGIQLFTALCGGKLIHHLDGHENRYHTFKHFKNDSTIKVNSLHHQMCIPPEDGFIVGWSGEKLSDIYIGKEDKLTDWSGPEVEAIILPKQKCAGVQWHPEMMPKSSSAYEWFYLFMFDFLTMDMDEFVETYTEGKKHEFSISTQG